MPRYHCSVIHAYNHYQRYTQALLYVGQVLHSVSDTAYVMYVYLHACMYVYIFACMHTCSYLSNKIIACSYQTT